MAVIAESVNYDFGKAIAFLDQLDKPSGEWELFRHRNDLRHPCWKERLKTWRIHFALLHKMVGNGAADIESMFQHLTILDGKFSLALALNSFVLTAVTFLLTHVPDMTGTITNAPLRGDLAKVFVVLSGIVGGLCLWNIWNCLLGVRRLVWGDLSRWVNLRVDPSNEFRVDLEGDLDWVRDDHAKALIVAIATRTNRFRIAIYATKSILVLVIVLFVYTIALLLFTNKINAISP
jgi:hypothetical protein